MRIALLIESHASDSPLSHTDGDLCSAGAGPGLQNRADQDASPEHAEGMRQAPATLTAPGRRAVPDDPDLAAVVAAWPGLPQAIRASILSMIRGVPDP